MKTKIKIFLILGIIALAIALFFIFKDNSNRFDFLTNPKYLEGRTSPIYLQNVFYENCTSMDDWLGSGFSSSNDLCQASNGNPDFSNSTSFSLAGYTSANISFYWNFTGLDVSDYIRLNVSNGTTWKTIYSRISDDVDLSDAGTQQIRLNQFINFTSTMYIQLICKSGVGEFCRFDNINVTISDTPSGTINSPSDATILKTPSLLFNGTVNPYYGTIKNVSLWGDWGNGWEAKEVNTSSLNNTNYLFNYVMSGFSDTIDLSNRSVYDIYSNDTYFWTLDAVDYDNNLTKFYHNGTIINSIVLNNSYCSYVSDRNIFSQFSIQDDYIYASCYDRPRVSKFYLNGTLINNYALTGYPPISYYDSGDAAFNGFDTNSTHAFYINLDQTYGQFYITTYDLSDFTPLVSDLMPRHLGLWNYNNTALWDASGLIYESNNTIWIMDGFREMQEVKDSIFMNKSIQFRDKFLTNTSVDYNGDIIYRAFSLYNNYSTIDSNYQDLLILSYQKDGFNQSIFHYRSIPSSSYKWNIQLCDTNNDCYFLGNNQTLIVNYSQIQEPEFDYDYIGLRGEEGNKTFRERATFRCLDDDSGNQGNNCGNVTAYLRYNVSNPFSDTIINSTFYDGGVFFLTNISSEYGSKYDVINSSDYKVPCGLMTYGDGCSVVFEGNKTDTNVYEMDIIFVSDLIGVSAKQATQSDNINITSTDSSQETSNGNFLYEYTGESFSVASQAPDAYSITTNGSLIWILQSVASDTVFVYYSNGTYTGTTWVTTTAGADNGQGITTNNSRIWITDDTDDQVYEFFMNGTYTGFNFDTALSGNGNPLGITENLSHFWVADDTDNRIYSYWKNGTSITNSTTTALNSGVRGLYYNGSILLATNRIASNVNDFVFLYNGNGVYQNQKFFTGGSGNTDAFGITSDGTYVYTVDPTTDRVYKYWDNKPNRYQYVISSTTFTSLYGITVNNTNLWTTQSSIEFIRKLLLNGTLLVSTDVVPPLSLQLTGLVSNDSHIYILSDGVTNNNITEHFINITLTGLNFYTNHSMTNGTTPVGVAMNDTYIWILDVSNDQVCRFWHNGTFTNSCFTTNGGIGNLDGFGITFNGTYFWITDATNEAVYQYYQNGTYTGKYFNLGMTGGDLNYVNLISRGITQNGTHFFVADNSNGVGKGVYVYKMGESQIVTPPSNTCTYGGSGDWVMSCNCNIISNTNVGGNKIVFNDTGTVYINATLTGVTKMEGLKGCKVVGFSGAKISK